MYNGLTRRQNNDVVCHNDVPTRYEYHVHLPRYFCRFDIVIGTCWPSNTHKQVGENEGTKRWCALFRTLLVSSTDELMCMITSLN